MVVCIRKLVALVRNRRIENKIYILVDQPGNMTVRQFRRVAFGFAWNRINAEFVDFSCGLRRENHTETELLKERCPERIVFIHVQYTRKSDGPAGCFGF